MKSRCSLLISALLSVLILTPSLPSYATSSPQIGTITPSSGTSSPNQSVTFTTIYFNSNGWQDIQEGLLLIGTSTNKADCFYGYYNQNTNKLYLRNDIDTAWLGGYSPGSSNIIENSYARLDCSKTTVSGSGSTLTIKWPVTFKSSFTGTKNIYLSLKDGLSAYQEWTKKGTRTITNRPFIFATTYSNRDPAIDTIAPSSEESDTTETLDIASIYTETEQTTSIEGTIPSSDISQPEEAVLPTTIYAEPKEEIAETAPKEVALTNITSSDQPTDSDSISPAKDSNEAAIGSDDGPKASAGPATAPPTIDDQPVADSVVPTKKIDEDETIPDARGSTVSDSPSEEEDVSPSDAVTPDLNDTLAVSSKNSPAPDEYSPAQTALSSDTPFSSAEPSTTSKLLVAKQSPQATSELTAEKTNNAAIDNAQFKFQNVPTTMIAGHSYSVGIIMKNTGTTTWTKSSNYKLGAQNPQDNQTWGLGRVLFSDTDSIAPGQGKVFVFEVKAPSQAGSYNFQWRMVKEGIAWFGDYTANVSITVDVQANSTPSVGIIVPSSGAVNPTNALAFTTTYTDPDGWQDIQQSFLLVNTSIDGANSFFSYYNQNTNKLYLMDDAGTSWLGGYAPGSANVIENSYAKLDCAGSSVSGNGTTLIVKWFITFKYSFAGSKNTYLKVIDDNNAFQDWTQVGTLLITNQGPFVGTITPSSGISNPDQAVTFTTTFSDLNGWQDIHFTLLLINNVLDGKNSFFGYYNQNTNKLYLMDDTGTAWLGGYAPGSSSTIENAYAKLDCSQSTVSGSGTTLTVNWSIAFKSTFMGTKNSYLYVRDDSAVSHGWIQKGTWAIQSPTDNAQFTSQSVPATMTPGQTYSVSVTIKNTGTTTWTKASNYKLGSQNPQDNSTWGLGRVLLSDADSVVPGQSKTFSFQVNAPSTDGTYNFQWRMVKEGVAWFGDYTTNLAIKVSQNDNAQYISQSVSSTMVAGQTYSASVTMNNTGTSTWTKSSNYKLGSQNPQDNQTWGLGRALLSDTDSIAAGQSKTFTFSVTAPQTAGTYDFQWQMLKEGVAWFGDYSTNVSINVQASPVLSVNVSPDIINIGGVNVDSVTTTTEANKIIVLNNGTSNATYSLSLVEPPDWTASQTAAGLDIYVLNAAFSGSVGTISWNETDHALSTIPVSSTLRKFAGDQTGVDVTPNEERTLWLQFKAPTTTAITTEQDIEIIVNAQLP